MGAAPWPPGFYRCVPVLRLWVVVLAELPKTPETRLLRMFGPPPMQLAVLAELDQDACGLTGEPAVD